MSSTKLPQYGSERSARPEEPDEPRYGSRVICSIPAASGTEGSEKRSPIRLIGTVISETFLHNVPGQAGPVKFLKIETELTGDEGSEKIRIRNVPVKWVKAIGSHVESSELPDKLTTETMGKITSLVPGLWQTEGDQSLRTTHPQNINGRVEYKTTTIAEANPVRTYSISVKGRDGGIEKAFAPE